MISYKAAYNLLFREYRGSEWDIQFRPLNINIHKYTYTINN